MKKIYTIGACLFLAFGSNAQNDFSATLTEYTPESSTTDNKVNLKFDLGYNGPATINQGTVIAAAFILDGEIFSFSNTKDNISTFGIQVDLASGASTSIGVPLVSAAPRNSSFTGKMCIVFFGVGTQSYDPAPANIEDRIKNDINTANNISCVNVVYPVLSSTNLELTFGKMFYSNNEIVFTNTSALSDENVALNITNLAGQIVAQESFGLNQGSTKIAVGNLPTGLYVAQFIVDDKTYTKKFVIN